LLIKAEAKLEEDNTIFSLVQKALDFKKSDKIQLPSVAAAFKKKVILKKSFTESEAQRQKKSISAKKKLIKLLIKKISISDIVTDPLIKLIPAEPEKKKQYFLIFYLIKVQEI
jgi:hypothetical protein